MKLEALGHWLDERFHPGPVLRAVERNLRKPVPPHVNWWFTLGAALIGLLGVQIATGLLLMVYYKPGGGAAHQSVEHIIESVSLGWFVRALHAWGSHLIVALALLHMVRVIVYGGYKRPRELTWVLGVLLLAVILGFGFTGYLLPWDQVAYWGTVVATEAPASIPLAGPYIREFTIGGQEVADATLGRFFVLHVMLLPAALLSLMGLHLFLVRYQGISPLDRTDAPEAPPAQGRAAGGRPFLPHHALKDAATVYVVLGALVSLALLLPPDLGPRADPLNTPVGIKPEWYFLPAYQLLKYVPEAVGVQAPPLFLLLLLLLPFLIDTSPERHPRRRARLLGGMAAVAGMVFFLGLLGYLSETTHSFAGLRYHFDVLGRPHRVEAAGKAGP